MTIQSSTEPYLDKYMNGSRGNYYYTLRDFNAQGLLNEYKNPISNRLEAFPNPKPYSKQGQII
jgi:hypothetical protein